LIEVKLSLLGFKIYFDKFDAYELVIDCGYMRNF